MIHVSMTVNGKAVSAQVDPRTLLVQFLRENLRLTGTHVGCDTSQCGACVVHVDGRAIKSCTPGMIMTSVDIVNRKGSNLDEATIRHELEGNICRCTGYHNIVKAVKQGAAEMGATSHSHAAE